MKIKENSLILPVILVRDMESLFHMRGLFKGKQEYCLSQMCILLLLEFFRNYNIVFLPQCSQESLGK